MSTVNRALSPCLLVALVVCGCATASLDAEEIPRAREVVPRGLVLAGESA
jgi:hypothetical protein